MADDAIQTSTHTGQFVIQCDIGLIAHFVKTQEFPQSCEQDRTGLSRVTEGCGRQTEMEAAGQRVDRTGLDFPESQRAVEDRQRWRQLVREWTGLDCPESQRAVGNRQRWGKLVREWTGLEGLCKTARDGGSWSESGQSDKQTNIQYDTNRQTDR